jgi:rod shape-determining protein MreC
VIGSSGSDLSRSIYIDKGENAGLKPDMAVITAGGIVGKVWIVYPSTSLVLMINDQSSGVGAMVEKSRLQGVVRGTPNGELILDRVMSDETIAPGEILLSSGGDRIFPKGLPVGRVSKVSPGKEMFLNIRVRPAADLSRVEEVLVVTEKQDREPVAESGGTVRAADILAQRLPSVPVKPAAVAGSVPAGGGAGAQASVAGAKTQPNVVGKPASVTGNTGTEAKTTGGAATAPAGSNAGSAHGISPAGETAPSGEVLKKVVQKNVSEGSAPGTNAASVTGSDSAPSVTSKPANTPAKPATAQPKVTSPPANPQPAATEDNPH